MLVPLHTRAPLRCALILALLATAACGERKPSGQTVATVNGEDVTLSELNLEAKGAATKEGRAAALQAIIDRKLFAEDARKQGLEKEPAYILEQRRAAELLLAQRNVAVLVRNAQRTPSESDVNAYLARYGGATGGQRILMVDQLRFPAPKTEAEYDALKPVKTNDALAEMLRGRGAAVNRGTIDVDSATLTDDVLKALLTSGEPIITVQGGMAISSQLVGSRPSERSGTDVAEIARKRLVLERVDAAIKQRAKALRDEGQITYANDYKPNTAGGQAR
ncbi:hypothetical protein [Sphingomonas profundi]|uniref:hypothetical protein n=1 Tax=Alterirhizorhabdus profundi TaxID=2681549 RepID=UPI0012E7DEB2|nr:hypothetical protein [Sphingomonas profundi]